MVTIQLPHQNPDFQNPFGYEFNINIPIIMVLQLQTQDNNNHVCLAATLC